MAAEVYAFVEAFDAAHLRATNMQRTYVKKFQLFMYTDSLQLSDSITRGRRTNERRLMIDILATRQSYKRYEISGVGYISGVNNPADGLTKLGHNKVLEEVFYEGRINRRAEKWIDRGKGQSLSAEN